MMMISKFLTTLCAVFILKYTHARQASVYTISYEQYQRWSLQLSSQAAELSSRAAELSSRAAELSSRAASLEPLASTLAAFASSQAAQISSLESRLRYQILTSCASRIRHEVQLIGYKYMSWVFVRHFPNLKSLVYQIYFGGSARNRDNNDCYDADIRYALKRMSQQQRFAAFIQWLLWYDDYNEASESKITDVVYRNGRLKVFARALRDTFKKKSGPIVAKKLSRVYELSCTVDKHDALTADDVKEMMGFVQGIIKLFRKDEEVDECAYSMNRVFSRPHQITRLEREILIKNKWF